MIMRAIWTRLAPGIAALALALASGAANAVDDCDFLTGGGFIIIHRNDGDAKANFGVGGGCKNGTATWGHLEYIDHGIGLNVHATSITAYFVDNSVIAGVDSQGRPTGSRFICGKARTNLYGDDIDFVVRANDTGEPGTTDEFDIQLLSTPPYSTFTSPPFPHKLNGGNIQLQKPNPSTRTGTFSDPTSCPALGAA